MKNQITLSITGQGFENGRTFGFLKVALVAAILLVASMPTFAQRETQGHVVRGTVISATENTPLPGVNIVLVGTTTGTSTDAEGKFEFPQRLNEGSQLLFSFVNAKSQTYNVQGTEDENVTIRLEDTLIMIECLTDDTSSVKRSRRLFSLKNR